MHAGIKKPSRGGPSKESKRQRRRWHREHLPTPPGDWILKKTGQPAPLGPPPPLPPGAASPELLALGGLSEHLPGPSSPPPVPRGWRRVLVREEDGPWRNLCEEEEEEGEFGPVAACARGGFESHWQLARFYWKRLERGWEVDEAVLSVPLLQLNLHVCVGRNREFCLGAGGRRGEYCLGTAGPRLGCTGHEWNALHHQGALGSVRSYFDDAAVPQPVAPWPRPPAGFTGPLHRLPRVGAAVSLSLHPTREAACWVSVAIRPFGVAAHDMLEYVDHWDGLPEGRADEVADRRERADAATRRYFDDDWDGLPDDALEEGPGDDNDAWAWGEVDDFEGED